MTWTATGYSSVRRASISPRARAFTQAAVRQLIAADALRVVQVDATRVGGVTEWLQVAAHASGRGLPRAARRRHDASPSASRRHGRLRGTPADRVHSLDARRVHRATIIREGYLHRPQAPGASTAIDPGARSRWQIRESAAQGPLNSLSSAWPPQSAASVRCELFFFASCREFPGN